MNFSQRTSRNILEGGETVKVRARQISELILVKFVR